MAIPIHLFVDSEDNSRNIAKIEPERLRWDELKLYTEQ